jgi:hypothetical protein
MLREFARMTNEFGLEGLPSSPAPSLSLALGGLRALDLALGVQAVAVY